MTESLEVFEVFMTVTLFGIWIALCATGHNWLEWFGIFLAVWAIVTGLAIYIDDNAYLWSF